jgi:hypothetical protein
VDAIGGTISAVSDKMMKVVPVVGIFGGVLGEATNSLATFMHTMDGMVSRFADFSPGLAMAQVNADMRQMFGDFRRAQEAGPALASFLKARGDMQEKFEDMKVRLLNRAMPLIITGMKAVENLMPVAEAMLNMLTSVAEHVPGLGDKIDAIKKQMERERKLWEDAKPSTIDEIGRWFDNPIPSGPE